MCFCLRYMGMLNLHLVLLAMFQVGEFFNITMSYVPKYWVVVSNIFYFHPYLGK